MKTDTKQTENLAEYGNKSKPLLPAVFSDLLVEHDYYCSDSAYHNLGFQTDYKKFKDFYDEMGNSDDDMNLVFRFDIKTRDENEIEGETSKYFMEIFMVHQRKGRFVPFFIENVYETDFELMKEYLQRKYHKIQQIWSPFSVL